MTHVPTWTWEDEASVIRKLREQSVRRYVQASLRRARDFRGRPLTPEWEATLLQVAERVVRANVHA